MTRAKVWLTQKSPYLAVRVRVFEGAANIMTVILKTHVYHTLNKARLLERER